MTGKSGGLCLLKQPPQEQLPLKTYVLQTSIKNSFVLPNAKVLFNPQLTFSVFASCSSWGSILRSFTVSLVPLFPIFPLTPFATIVHRLASIT